MSRLEIFVRESNLIEGIKRNPTSNEIGAHETLLMAENIDVDRLCEFQEIIAPGKPLRTKPGMDVKVGNYVAPPGGVQILLTLQTIVFGVNFGTVDPWTNHVAFENLHPFMDGNGRTGRALWAWQMHHTGRDPFALPFLHRFYYQTLENTEDGMMITDLIERLRRHYEICAAIDLPLIISPPS